MDASENPGQETRQPATWRPQVSQTKTVWRDREGALGGRSGVIGGLLGDARGVRVGKAALALLGP